MPESFLAVHGDHLRKCRAGRAGRWHQGIPWASHGVDHDLDDGIFFFMGLPILGTPQAEPYNLSFNGENMDDTPVDGMR